MEIFDSSVSLTWEESDGVFTYRTINDGTDMDIAIELSYDSASDSYQIDDKSLFKLTQREKESRLHSFLTNQSKFSQ